MTSRDGTYLRDLPDWALEIFPELERRQPGDVTVADVVAAYKAAGTPMSERGIRDDLQARVTAGELTECVVYDPAHPKRRVLVWRKARAALAPRPMAQPAQPVHNAGVPKKVRKGKSRR